MIKFCSKSWACGCILGNKFFACSMNSMRMLLRSKDEFSLRWNNSFESLACIEHAQGDCI